MTHKCAEVKLSCWEREKKIKQQQQNGNKRVKIKKEKKIQGENDKDREGKKKIFATNIKWHLKCQNKFYGLLNAAA